MYGIDVTEDIQETPWAVESQPVHDEDWGACLRLLCAATNDASPDTCFQPSRNPGTSASIAYGKNVVRKEPGDESVPNSGLSKDVKPEDALPTSVARRREAQHRFRKKQKERTQNVQSLLADTASRLQQAELERANLATRNQVLESLLFSQAKQPSGIPGLTASIPPQVVKSVLQPSFQVTQSNGKASVMTVHDIVRLSGEEMTSLYTAAIRQMRAVLKPDAEGISRPAYEQLKTMMVQATTVKLCMVVCDPTAARQLACFKAAPKFGTAVSNPPNASHVLALMGFSKSQVEDLLTLRMLFFSRLGALAAERTALARDIGQSLDLHHIRTCSERLHHNITEEQDMHTEIVTAVHFGINTALQSALWSLAAYPTLLNFPLLEALAEKYAQPSSSKIMSQPPDHALTWQNVEAYIGALGTMHTYVPFLSSSQAKASVL